MEAIGIIFNFVWQLLSIEIPVSEFISFKLWQFFGFIFLIYICSRFVINLGGSNE